MSLILPKRLYGVTLEWTTGHLDFFFFPVDLGVVVLEPVIA